MSLEDPEKPTQIALHSIRNILGEQQQQSLFSDHDRKFSEAYGIDLHSKIERFGIDLTDMQARVMEGVLRGFSITDYQGNIKESSTQEIAQSEYGGKLPEIYKYIESLPRLRLTQAKLLELSGIDRNSIASVARALEAFRDLGTKQYCFFYDRIACGNKGEPICDTSGAVTKEQVVAVDTLFTVKEVRDQQSGKLRYYEILPSPIFLDQRDSYFLLVPNNWREEVRRLYGNKKSSSYTFQFLLFLRYQYELKRRSETEINTYTISWAPEEIATAIKMSQTVIKRNPKRMNQVLEDAYSVAKKLGYLIDYSRRGYIDELTLNDDKYFSSKHVHHTSKDYETSMSRGVEQQEQETDLLAHNPKI